MAPPKPRVTVTWPLPEPAGELLAACDTHVHPGPEPMDADQLRKAAATSQGLVCLLRDRIDADVLECGTGTLQVVGNYAVGVDNIDLEAAARLGIRVVNTPDVLTEATADLAWALILAVTRRVVEADAFLREGRFRGWEPELLLGSGLQGRVLGILGMGRIGTRVARVAAAFGMGVRYHDLREIEERDRHGAQPVDLKSLFSLSDLVTLHVDGRPDNRGLIGASELAWLKPGAVLINTSRGFVAPPEPLAQWLGRDPSAQAFIDVHEPEPFGPDYPLLARPNAHLTPHTASATRSAKVRMSWVVRDVCRVLDGETPRHRAV